MEIWLEVILVALIAYLIRNVLLWASSRRERNKAAAKVTQFGERHPIWGNLHLVKDAPDIMKRTGQLVRNSRTKIIAYWKFHWPSIITTHPDTAQNLMKSHASKPVQRGFNYHTLLPWLGDGLLLSEGKKWERNRRLLTPAFHFDVLRPYMKIYNQVAELFLNKLWSYSSEGKKSVEIYEPTSLATLDTMLRCALSYEGHVQEQGSTHPYVQAVKDLSRLAGYRVVRPWLQFYWIFCLTANGRKFQELCDYVHGFADTIIAERRSSLKEDPSILKKRHLDFLDILVTAKDENGIGLTDQEIRAEVDTFLFEGHDTTASGISWAMYCLAKYPDEQQKVYEELSEILKEKPTVEWDDLPQLKHMALFIKEVFRHYPPVPSISRILDKPMDIGGVTFPKGSDVAMYILGIHSHPDVWSDVDTFRPERFLDDRDPYSFVPFSAGPRNCIGQNFALNEVKVILARLLKRFQISLDPDHKVEAVALVVLRAKNGIKLFLEER